MSAGLSEVAWMLAAPGAGLLLRVAGAVGIAALLYLLLHESGQGPREGAPRRVAFAALGALVFVVLTEPRPAPSGSPGRAFESYAQGVLAARRAFATTPWLRLKPVAVGSVDESLLAEAIRYDEAAFRASPGSLTIARQLAALQAAAGRWDAARATAASVVRILGERGAEGAAQRSLWETAFGRRPLKGPALQAADRAVVEQRLGWFGLVLREALARRAKDADAAKRLRAEVAGASDAYMRRVVVVAILTFGLMLLGVVLAIVLGIMIATRALKPVPANPARVAAILWEGFILYMAVSISPALLRGGAGAAARTPEAVVGAALLTDLLALLPLVYVGVRLRRRRVTLAELGFRSQSVGADVLWGIGAYLATAPFIRLVAWLTAHLTERYFPNVAPPYHPVTGLMLGAQGTGVRVGLFLLVAVGAPLLEETYFRGALQGALRRRGGPLAAALLSSAVFAILHPQLPLGFIPIFLLGFTFALLYEWRQSLLPGMVMHALNNGLIYFVMTALFPVSG